MQYTFPEQRTSFNISDYSSCWSKRLSLYRLKKKKFFPFILKSYFLDINSKLLFIVITLKTLCLCLFACIVSDEKATIVFTSYLCIECGHFFYLLSRFLFIFTFQLDGNVFIVIGILEL